MSVTVVVRNEDLLNAHQQLSVLTPWLRPGVLASGFAMLKVATHEPAKGVFDERQHLVEEYTKADPVTGEPMVTEMPGGERRELTKPKEFIAKEKALMDGTTEITIPKLLDEGHFQKLENNYVKDTTGLAAPDLAPIMRCFYTGYATVKTGS